MQIIPGNYQSRPPLSEVVPAAQANPSLHLVPCVCFLFVLYLHAGTDGNLVFVADPSDGGDGGDGGRTMAAPEDSATSGSG